jgi:hypothetical protein
MWKLVEYVELQGKQAEFRWNPKWNIPGGFAEVVMWEALMVFVTLRATREPTERAYTGNDQRWRLKSRTRRGFSVNRKALTQLRRKT